MVGGGGCIPNIGTISSLISELVLAELDLSWVELRDEWELDKKYCDSGEVGG